MNSVIVRSNYKYERHEAFVILSQLSRAEKNFHYGHLERGGTVAISNSRPAW